MYVPFLKLKKNEILSLKILDGNVLGNITPFFDIPRIKDMGEEDFKKRIEMGVKDLTRHWDNDRKFYLDTFDVDQDLRPDGLCPFSYVRQALEKFNFIPVAGIDRDDEHLNSVREHLDEMETKVIAVRFLPNDFESYDLIKEEIEDILGGLIGKCDKIDLILDCRVVVANRAISIAEEAVAFTERFCKDYAVGNVILTGSSIPASIADIVPTNSETYFPRYEIQVWKAFNASFNQELTNTVFGDYGVISPEYSDIDLDARMLATVASPKAIYTLEGQHYAVRGSRFRTHADGYGQYFNLARQIASKDFFRGPHFSSGDEYITQKSQNIPKAGSPQTWIKNTLNSHITYIVDEIS